MRKEDREGIVPRSYWGPLGLLDEMERMLDNLRMGWGETWFPSFPIFSRTFERIPAVDIKDLGDKYIIQAEMPGIGKEDVEIEIVDGALEIKAKKEEEKEEKGVGYVRRERGRLSFYRRIPIYEDIDQEKIEAKMEDGVLEITLPKLRKVEEKRKRVEVK
ncbi:MAG: Hsp20/alpha crystallin family protein [Methanomassiliicoccales archaeon]